MLIVLKTLKRYSLILKVAKTDTLEEEKNKLEMQEGFTADKIILIFTGKDFNDQRTLEDHNIANESTFHMLFRRVHNNNNY